MKNTRLHKTGLLLIAAGASVASNSASAQDSSDHRFYVAPFGSYTIRDHDRGTKNGYGGGVAVGKRFTNFLELELIGNYTKYKSDTTNFGDTRLWGAGAGANIFPFSSGALGGFFVHLDVQRGQGHHEPGAVRAYTTTLFDAGLGYNLTLTHSQFGPFAPGIALQFQALYLHDAHNDDNLGSTNTGGSQYFQEALFKVGFHIPLGGRSLPAAPPPPEEAAQVVPVEEPTPPAEAPAAAPEPPPPPPCEPPVPGQPINLDGCKVGDTFVLRGVNFEFNKATLTVNAKALLDPVADALIARPAVKVEVDGHTDSRGSNAYNQRLSDRRAASVMQYLVGRGIDAGRLSSKGFGETMPIADNKTDDGRELNRRVELKITDDGSSAAPSADTPAPTEPAAADSSAAPAPADAAAPADGSAPADAAAPADATPAPADASAPAEAAPADAAPADGSTPPPAQ